MVFGAQRILVWNIREAKPRLHFQNGWGTFLFIKIW